jgi:hypothetical protein
MARPMPTRSNPLATKLVRARSPTTWKSVGPAQKGAGPDSVLGDIPATALKGATVWQIRVVVEHNNGSVREARFKMTLG